MQFVKISSIEPAATYLSDIIAARLGGGSKVLWLVSGGSVLDVVVETARLLVNVNCTNLAVTLTDERYGPDGHADSNWQQLQDKGFMLQRARLLPVLQNKGFTATVTLFSQMLETEFKKADCIIGFFGIGADGHTAGILPSSPALETRAMAAGYSADLVRITMTPLAIKKLNEAAVYAVGESKWPMLDSLKTILLPAQQPAQLLKQIPKLTIFNDYKQETI